MIAPMKKVSIVLLDKDKKDSLTSLKKLGVMHLSDKIGTSDDVKALEEEIKDIETALKYTDESAISHDVIVDINSIKSTIAQIDKLGKEVDNLEEKESILNRDIDYLKPWGDFNPSDIKLLEEKGILVTLLEVSKDQVSKFPEDVTSFKIAHNNLGELIAVVGNCPSDYTVFTPPELGLEDSYKALDLILADIDDKAAELKKLSVFHDQIIKFKEYLEDQLEFEKIKAGMGYDEDFAVLEGWIPTEKIDSFKKEAGKRSWGIALADPIEGDNTPTWVKSSKVVSMIHPLLDFLGNVPGYWEKDVSGYFLLFFTVFFAMIIGDAGYGFLFLGITAFAHYKTKKFNSAIGLFYLLSAATVVWGAVTGNWFGSNFLKGIPALNGFMLPQLGSDIQIMELCFNIAVIHLVLGRTLAFVKDIKEGKISAFANLGWATMIVGLLFLVRNLVLNADDYPVPQSALLLIAVGFGIVVLFGKQEKGKNFFKGVASGLLGSLLTALDSIGAFGDIISYIRLYAVGLAGLAVAQSFNTMAAPMLDSGAVGIGAGILILLAGHTLNIGMAVLSVLVHGVRLNVLEFSSHADVNWTGIKFDPLREKKII